MNTNMNPQTTEAGAAAGAPPPLPPVTGFECRRDAEGDIAAAMGPRGWRRLSPAIRERFGRSTADYGAHSYEGVMSTVACTGMGWLLAQACRLIGTPLAPHAGRDIPVSCAVYPAADGSGVVWDRTYAFPGRKPVTVSSTKVLDRSRKLLEVVGGGLGMELAVYEYRRTLNFRSQRYFWSIAGRRIPLPALLSPGVAHVVHSDEGGGFFRFTITIDHPLLGRLFFQDGIFTETED